MTTIGLDLLGLGEGDILKFIPLTTTPTAPSSSPTSSSTVPPTGQDDYPATEQDLEERIRNDEKIEGATIRITGLRNPCPQIDKFRTGLREKFLVRDKDRNVVGRKAGVMSTVEKGGWVRPGMKILIEKAGERRELVCV